MEKRFSKINPVRGRAPLGARSTRPLARAASNGIKVIIGLGNPGAEYENTYHNAGKLMLDYLSEIVSSENNLKNIGFKKLSSSGCFEVMKSENLTLVKSLTYMNESGKAAKLVLKNLKAEAGSLIVVHDDSDIELGDYKLSFGRGSAGHRGAQSVIESLGTKDFWRLRIGIRGANPPSSAQGGLRRARAGKFVLKKITGADGKLLRSAFEKAYKEIFGKSVI